MAESVSKPSLGKRIVQYFHDVKAELKKVVWPTFPQTVHDTLVVIAFIFVVSVVLFILDFIFSGAISAMLRGDFANGFLQWFKFN